MTAMRAISTALWMGIEAVLLLLLLAVLAAVLSIVVWVTSVTHAFGQTPVRGLIIWPRIGGNFA